MESEFSKIGQSLEARSRSVIDGKLLASLILSPKDVIFEMVEISIIIRPVDDVVVKIKGFKHWVLEVEFPDRTLYFEAYRDINGVLVPSFSEVKPENIEKRVPVGKTKISPYKVVKLAHENKQSNIPYDVLSANCQTWIKEFASSLGIKNIDIATVGKIFGLLTTVSSVAFGIPGSIASIAAVQAFKYLSKNGSSSAETRSCCSNKNSESSSIRNRCCSKNSI